MCHPHVVVLILFDSPLCTLHSLSHLPFHSPDLHQSSMWVCSMRSPMRTSANEELDTLADNTSHRLRQMIASAISECKCLIGSLTPQSCCMPPLGFGRRRWSGFQLVMVQKLVAHEVPRMSLKWNQITRILAPPPDAKRPSRVSPCQKSVIRCPSEECNGVQESRGAGMRSCASSRPARWQRGGQRVQRRKRP